ncbi:MAG: acyl-ACP--UDP-N-acetylglucosamine O-acyltransferase [Pseudomonadota bacterium]
MNASSIHPTAILDPAATLAETVRIGPFCVIGPHVTLDDNVVLHSHVSIEGRTHIGPGTEVHPFARLGGPPQHTGYRGEDTCLTIGAHNIIREHTTMNIGTAAGGGETRVGNHGFFMTGAHVGHDCVVGDHVIFANNATLGGHVVVGNNVFLGGLSAVHQHCQVGAFAFLGGCAAVIHDVIPFGSANGNYAVLEGLNIIGMKRQNMEKPVINDLRHLFRHLFDGDGRFQDRLASVPSALTQSAEANRILDFIHRPRKRPLMLAGR